MLRRAHWWVWAIFCTGLVAIARAPSTQRFPCVLVSTFVFAAVLTWLPRCRPRIKPLICPWNWALFLFAIQLLGLPLLITIDKPSAGVLPALPSSSAIDSAISLNCLAFVSFCAVYNHLSKFQSHPSNCVETGSDTACESTSPSRRWIVVAVLLGIMGLWLSFGHLDAIFDYFNDPSFYRDYLTDASSTWKGLAALLLKPFLGFAVIATWCRWMDSGYDRSSGLLRLLVMLLTIAATILSFASFGYNRGAFVIPLLSIAGIILARADRFSKLVMVTVGLILLALMPALAIYRSSSSAGQDLLERSDLAEMALGKVDLSDLVQMYGGAPQYLGFLIERSHWGRDASWGATTVSSILSPVPVIGKSFRRQSGFTVYNRMIYGTDAIADQNAPFAGESFLDFNVVGVVLAFALFAAVIFRLQRSFDGSRSSVELYVWQYLSIWVCFVIFGSIEVPSQILIYSCWPIYLFWLNGKSAHSRVNSIYAVPGTARI